MADAGRWKPYVQRQGQLLPAFVDDALDPSDPVFFIDDVVDGLELTALEQRYATLGEHAYDPRLLLKLWLYGATQGVYSGRELARRVRRDLAFRYLAGAGPVPHHHGHQQGDREADDQQLYQRQAAHVRLDRREHADIARAPRQRREPDDEHERFPAARLALGLLPRIGAVRGLQLIVKCRRAILR